jgi:hypothetical protein
MQSIHEPGSTAFAPFGKGGYGGFALDPDFMKCGNTSRSSSRGKSESPLIPLFQRGRFMAAVLATCFPQDH